MPERRWKLVEVTETLPCPECWGKTYRCSLCSQTKRVPNPAWDDAKPLKPFGRWCSTHETRFWHESDHCPAWDIRTQQGKEPKPCSIRRCVVLDAPEEMQ